MQKIYQSVFNRIQFPFDAEIGRHIYKEHLSSVQFSHNPSQILIVSNNFDSPDIYEEASTKEPRGGSLGTTNEKLKSLQMMNMQLPKMIQNLQNRRNHTGQQSRTLVGKSQGIATSTRYPQLNKPINALSSVNLFTPLNVDPTMSNTTL